MARVSKKAPVKKKATQARAQKKSAGTLNFRRWCAKEQKQS